VQNFYDYCIFCGKELTTQEIKGKGDHIVPEYMYGSICMKEVCKSCNNRLGSKADFDAIEEARIISAAFKLDLPEIQAKIRDRGSGKIVDAKDGSEGEVRFKGGRPRVVPRQATATMFVSDETNARAHLLNRLRKDRRHGLTDDELQQHVNEELWPKYEALAYGESVTLPRLGTTLRKLSGKIHQNWKVTENAAMRLVAKIGYETAFLVFNRDCRDALPVLAQLADIAMGNVEVDRTVLAYPLSKYSPVTPPPHNPQYHHQIVVNFTEFANFIDIYFFGIVGFRVILRGSSSVAYGSLIHSEGDIEMISYLMTFEPGEPRRKFLFVRRVGAEDVEEHESSGLL
jgi:hypothetical protein